jgi:diguanylate cyclase (GGDEF)-like protein
LQTLEDITTGFCAAGAAIAVADADWRLLAVNATYAALTGQAPAELLGRRVQLAAEAEAGLQPPVGRAAPATPLEPEDPTVPASAGSRRWEGEVTLKHRDGQTRPTWMSIDTVGDACGATQRHVLTFIDISALKRQQDEWQYRAHHDALTGLPQRALFETALQQTLAASRRHGRRFALLFVDVDHFKRVNDTLGHAIGDLLLQEVGRRLRQAVRDEDLVARLGGDEFVVMLQEVDRQEHAAALARMMAAALSRSFEAEGHQLNVSASVGVAMFPGDGADAAGLIRAADAAMYCAKRKGPGRVACASDGRSATGPAVGFGIAARRGEPEPL